MDLARYDEVADFYEAGWDDSCDDPATRSLLELAGDVAGARVLDLACGHGRVTRWLARCGAEVTGADISARLIERALAAEHARPLGIRYLHADAAAVDWLPGAEFDIVTCNFGLSDIDDLDHALASAARLLRAGGQFVFSILHPCFPGGENVSGAWPAAGTYYTEGWWRADGELSSLRRQVGACHRTLATYLNTLPSTACGSMQSRSLPRRPAGSLPGPTPRARRSSSRPGASSGKPEHTWHIRPLAAGSAASQAGPPAATCPRRALALENDGADILFCRE